MLYSKNVFLLFQLDKKLIEAVNILGTKNVIRGTNHIALTLSAVEWDNKQPVSQLQRAKKWALRDWCTPVHTMWCLGDRS